MEIMENHGQFWFDGGFSWNVMACTLVMTKIAMARFTLFNGKTHKICMAIFHRYVELPEGIWEPLAGDKCKGDGINGSISTL